MESFDLKETFSEFEAANTRLKIALMAECNPDIFLAGEIRNLVDGKKINPLSIVANSLCMMWYEDRKFPFIEKEGGGFIIVSDEVMALAKALNENKSTFMAACLKISNGGRSVAKSKLKEENHSRNKELDDRLRTLGLSQLALWRCYKKITLVEDETRCIGWTWQRLHSYIKELEKPDALKICEKHNSHKNHADYDLWLNTVENIPNTKQIVLVREKKPQLRVNISYEKSLNKNKVQIASPSIILLAKSKQPKMPKHRWRSLNDVNTLSTNRSDKIIGDAKDYLGFLSLYAYDKPKAKDEETICET